jgi:dUTP pyrophosphatase
MIKSEKIKIKKLSQNAKIPTYGSEYSAGADIYALTENPIEIVPNETVLIHSGVAFEIPDGYVGLVFARSGLATKSGLAPANKVGVIDSDYRGELMVPLFNQSNKTQTISNGDRIAQIIFMPYLKADFFEDTTLSQTQRGEDGFGSTGK